MRVKVPGALLAIGAAVVLLGLIAALFGIADGWRSGGPSWRTPGSSDLQLEAGRWVIWERATDSDADPQTPLRRISVYGPSGTVALSCVSCGGSHQSMTMGTTSYVGVASFEAPTAGTYKVTVTEPGQVMMVAPSIMGGVLVFTAGVGLSIVGGVICMIALMWLVVAAVTRRH